MEPKNPSEPSFAQRVEEALLQVPPGRVVTYGGLALLAGRPRAARAVGMLMARNPYGELLPCHRVVSASGELSSRSFRQEQARRLGFSCGSQPVWLGRTEPIIKGGDLCVQAEW